MLPLLAGLLLIFVVSCVKVVRVARAANVPSAVRLGAVMTWMVGTLAVAVLPAFAALAILDAATGFVRFRDGGIDQLAAATLWVGLCDAANIGRLVAPRDEDRGGVADLTQDRRLLFVAAVIATVAYAAALLIAVGFVDHGHVAIGVAVVLGFVASAGTVQARPGGPGMGPLTRRPVDPGQTIGGDSHADTDTDDADTIPSGDAGDPRDAGDPGPGAGREPNGDRPGRRW